MILYDGIALSHVLCTYLISPQPLDLTWCLKHLLPIYRTVLTYSSRSDRATLSLRVLTAGGADSLYTYVGSSDLRPYNLTSGAMYMIQAIHTTLVMRFNDTLDFVVVSTSSSPPLFTVVRVSYRVFALIGFLKTRGADILCVANPRCSVRFWSELQKHRWFH